MLRFFSLTYALSWSCFMAAGALSSGVGSSGSVFSLLRAPLLLLSVFAPALVALGITAWDDGKPGIAALLRRAFEWPSALRWYVFAVGYLVALKLTAAVMQRLMAGAWPRFGNEPWYVIAGAILISTPVQAGEEIGWRGYGLPRLAARVGLAQASLVLGLIWACWHLPGFLVPGLHNYGQSFPLFVLGVIPLSVAMAWLYAHTNGSLLMMMLMHSAVNQTTGIVPMNVPGTTSAFAVSTSLAGCLFLVMLWLSAAYFLVRMPKAAVRAGDCEAVGVS